MYASIWLYMVVACRLLIIVPHDLMPDLLITALMQLINEVQNAQILLDTCVYASPAPNVVSRMDGSDGRRILRAEMGRGMLNHPPARPPFGCIVSPHP